jgi:hypothetical protein
LQHQIKQREYDITLVKEKMPQHSSQSVSSPSISAIPTKAIDPSVTKTMNWAVNHEIEELRKQMYELAKRIDILYDKMDSFIVMNKQSL